MADNRIAYGLAKRHGIDTTGMSPKEVWKALKEKGVTLGKDREADKERLVKSTELAKLIQVRLKANHLSSMIERVSLHTIK